MKNHQPVAPQERWFGTGRDGFRRLFSVWGKAEPKNVAKIPLRRVHTGTTQQFNENPELTARLQEILAGPERTRKRVDPRRLGAAQYGVTWSGVNYYLNQSQYAQTGWTWADQNDPVNREPVVWSSPDQGPVILTGHHRTVTALLLGESVDVVWVEADEPRTAGTRVAPLIWVGDCPNPHQVVANAVVAEPLIRAGVRCVLPSIEAAEQVLLLLGATPEWAQSAIAFATTGRVA